MYVIPTNGSHVYNMGITCMQHGYHMHITCCTNWIYLGVGLVCSRHVHYIVISAFFNYLFGKYGGGGGFFPSFLVIFPLHFWFLVILVVS